MIDRCPSYYIVSTVYMYLWVFKTFSKCFEEAFSIYSLILAFRQNVVGNTLFDHLENSTEYDIFIRARAIHKHSGAKQGNDFFDGPFSLNARFRTKDAGMQYYIRNIFH